MGHCSIYCEFYLELGCSQAYKADMFCCQLQCLRFGLTAATESNLHFEGKILSSLPVVFNPCNFIFVYVRVDFECVLYKCH